MEYESYIAFAQNTRNEIKDVKERDLLLERMYDEREETEENYRRDYHDIPRLYELIYRLKLDYIYYLYNEFIINLAPTWSEADRLQEIVRKIADDEEKFINNNTDEAVENMLSSKYAKIKDFKMSLRYHRLLL